MGALLALGGILLLALGYNMNPNNGSEITTGGWLIGIGVVMWILGFISKESKRGGLFH